MHDLRILGFRSVVVKPAIRVRIPQEIRSAGVHAGIDAGGISSRHRCAIGRLARTT
jgi:hypothetical protein